MKSKKPRNYREETWKIKNKKIKVVVLRDSKGRFKKVILPEKKYVQKKLYEKPKPKGKFWQIHAKINYKSKRSNHDIIIDAYAYYAGDMESAKDFMFEQIANNFGYDIANMCSYKANSISELSMEKKGKIMYKNKVEYLWRTLTITSYL